MTLPEVGGSTSGQTYLWDKLRFKNSSGSEKSIVDAETAGWLDQNIKFWDADPLLGSPSFDDINDGETLNSWQGYFISSNVDNLTLIRQN